MVATSQPASPRYSHPDLQHVHLRLATLADYEGGDLAIFSFVSAAAAAQTCSGS